MVHTSRGGHHTDAVLIPWLVIVHGVLCFTLSLNSPSLNGHRRHSSSSHFLAQKPRLHPCPFQCMHPCLLKLGSSRNIIGVSLLAAGLLHSLTSPHMLAASAMLKHYNFVKGHGARSYLVHYHMTAWQACNQGRTTVRVMRTAGALLNNIS